MQNLPRSRKVCCCRQMRELHLKTGGKLAFFPEGQIMKSPENFTFPIWDTKKALVNDACIFFLVTQGNATVCPMFEPLADFWQGKWTLKCVAEDGCQQLVKEVKKDKKSCRNWVRERYRRYIIWQIIAARRCKKVNDLYDEDKKQNKVAITQVSRIF